MSKIVCILGGMDGKQYYNAWIQALYQMRVRVKYDRIYFYVRSDNSIERTFNKVIFAVSLGLDSLAKQFSDTNIKGEMLFCLTYFLLFPAIIFRREYFNQPANLPRSPPAALPTPMWWFNSIPHKVMYLRLSVKLFVCLFKNSWLHSSSNYASNTLIAIFSPEIYNYTIKCTYHSYVSTQINKYTAVTGKTTYYPTRCYTIKSNGHTDSLAYKTGPHLEEYRVQSSMFHVLQTKCNSVCTCICMQLRSE